MHPSKLPILIEQVLYHAEFWYLIAASYTRRVDLILLDQQIRILPADAKHYYIITAKRFFIWNRYDLSQLMPFSEETSYSYTDCFTKVNVVQSGNTLCLYEEGYVQPYILSFLFLCVVLMLNILGDKSTPEE